MKDVDQRPRFGWALPASVTVHALAVALLIFGLPVSLFEAEQEKPIDVELVSPPEQPKQAQAAKPPPPAPKPPPEAKAEEAPEPQPEKKPETGKEDAKTAPENVLEPVHRFGEKDGGPKVATDGDSASEASAEAEAEKPEPQKPEEAKTQPAEEEKPAAAKPEPEQKDAAQPKELTAARSADQAPPAKEVETPATKPTPKQKKAAKAEQTKKLASRMDTGDVIATTAMGGLPRDVRAGRLCVTELRERMRNASPPYFPDLLPSYPLEKGNVLDIPRAAFRLGGAWYELSFRCEVDSNATEVLAFNFRVGRAIPPGEWKQRGLPAR